MTLVSRSSRENFLRKQPQKAPQCQARLLGCEHRGPPPARLPAQTSAEAGALAPRRPSLVPPATRTAGNGAGLAWGPADTSPLGMGPHPGCGAPHMGRKEPSGSHCWGPRSVDPETPPSPGPTCSLGSDLLWLGSLMLPCVQSPLEPSMAPPCPAAGAIFRPSSLQPSPAQSDVRATQACLPASLCPVSPAPAMPRQPPLQLLTRTCPPPYSGRGFSLLPAPGAAAGPASSPQSTVISSGPTPPRAPDLSLVTKRAPPTQHVHAGSGPCISAEPLADRHTLRCKCTHTRTLTRAHVSVSKPTGAHTCTLPSSKCAHTLRGSPPHSLFPV